MVNKKQFASMRNEIADFDNKRESVIQQSRDIIRLSKVIISGIHRDQVSNKDIAEIKQKVKKLPDQDYDTGMASVARQEYVEAVCFSEFMKKRSIPSPEDLQVDVQSYLLGLCDLTGELGRKAVNSVIQKDFKTTLEIHKFVADIYDEFLKFVLRNSELRKKVDQIKWNLKKLEGIVYDLKIKGMIK